MNYTESLAYLDSLGKFGIKLGMERIEGLLRQLGNPEQKIKTVHVTGAHGLLAFLVVWWGIFLPAGWRLAYYGRSLWLKAMGRGYMCWRRLALSLAA